MKEIKLRFLLTYHQENITVDVQGNVLPIENIDETIKDRNKKYSGKAVALI